MSDVPQSGQCSRRPLERLWIVIWFVQVNRIIQLTNYYNKLGFLCSLETVCTVVKIIWFSASCTREQRQQAALITSWQQSAVIMALRTDSHHSTVLSTTWRSFLLVTVMTAPLQWRALSEISLRGSHLWHSDSHESPFVLTLTTNMMWRDTVCMCEASIVQHRRLFLPPAGWPGGQHRWDKAGLFCSHDVMANKAPWWNWLPLCKPTITLDIDDVTDPRQPRLLQVQRGHEGGVIKVEGEVVFFSCFICTSLPLYPSVAA